VYCIEVERGTGHPITTPSESVGNSTAGDKLSTLYIRGGLTPLSLYSGQPPQPVGRVAQERLKLAAICAIIGSWKTTQLKCHFSPKVGRQSNTLAVS